MKIILPEPNVDPVIVEADRIRIDEVISNLLDNAVKSIEYYERRSRGR